jgi:plasmid stabilization system protein ParE
MAYLVKLMPRAERDLAAILSYVGADHSPAAFRWYQGLRDSIQTLERHPNRCPSTPESDDLRHLLYGKKPHVYRVIYRIMEGEGVVEILHIRHGARRPFRPHNLRRNQ